MPDPTDQATFQAKGHVVVQSEAGQLWAGAAGTRISLVKATLI